MIAPATVARFKEGVRAAISLAGGTEGAGATVEKSGKLAETWNNRNDPALPRIDYAYMLDAVAVSQKQRPPIISAMAADLGCVVIRLPDAGAGDDALATALIDASAEFGDIAAEVRDATRDGDVNQKERSRIVRQIDEAIEALARMRVVVSGKE